MPAIIKVSHPVPSAPTIRPLHVYKPKWPEAKGLPYRGRVPYLGKRDFVTMRCGYDLPQISVTFVASFKRAIDGPLSFKSFLHTVCEVWGVGKIEVLSPQRERRIAYPRMALCALLQELSGKSLPQIGRLLNRDHTTILHSIRKVSNLLRDSTFRAKFEECRRRLAVEDGDE